MNAARLVRWLWGGSPVARLARLPLIPLAGAYWAVTKLRAAYGGEPPGRHLKPDRKSVAIKAVA